MPAIRPPLPHLILAAAVGLGAFAAAAQTTAHDPRSGAALSVATLKAARASGLARSAAPVPVPQLIATGTVNNPAADATARDTQSTTTVVDLGGGKLVSAFTDSGSSVGGVNHFTGYSWSSDNGATWTDAGVLPADAEGDGGNPVLAYGRGVSAVYVATNGFTTQGNIQVYKSVDSGHTFGFPVNATNGFAAGDTADKPWIAVDNFPGIGNGNVYLCATHYAGSGNIVFTRSTNFGSSFGPNGGKVISTGGNGCFVTVSPSHQVSVFYYLGSGPHGQGGIAGIYMRRSLDNGVTFQREVKVAALSSTADNGEVLSAIGRINSFPQAVVNPVAARPYMFVFFNDGNDFFSRLNFVQSADNGVTWSAPNLGFSDSGKEVLPAAAIRSMGDRIVVSYYDVLQNFSTPGSTADLQRRARIGSIDASGLVSPIRQSFALGPVTPAVTAQDSALAPSYLSEYDGMAAGVTNLTAVWSDTRLADAFNTAQQDVRAAQITLPVTVADVSIGISPATATAALGQITTYTVTVTSPAVTATDVFVKIATDDDTRLVFRSASAAGGQCAIVDRKVGCSLGLVLPGQPRQILVDAESVVVGGASVVTATVTTSSYDAALANNVASAQITSTLGAALTTAHNSGTIAVPIPDLGTVEIPVTIPLTGTLVSMAVRVRLDHTSPQDLKVSLVAPNGRTVLLQNLAAFAYGSGVNGCAGRQRLFYDDSAGLVPPFDAKPVRPLMPNLADLPPNGVWKLRVSDRSAGFTGVIGCVSLSIRRVP